MSIKIYLGLRIGTFCKKGETTIIHEPIIGCTANTIEAQKTCCKYEPTSKDEFICKHSKGKIEDFCYYSEDT